MHTVRDWRREETEHNPFWGKSWWRDRDWRGQSWAYKTPRPGEDGVEVRRQRRCTRARRLWSRARMPFLRGGFGSLILTKHCCWVGRFAWCSRSGATADSVSRSYSFCWCVWFWWCHVWMGVQWMVVHSSTWILRKKLSLTWRSRVLIYIYHSTILRA